MKLKDHLKLELMFATPSFQNSKEPDEIGWIQGQNERREIIEKS